MFKIVPRDSSLYPKNIVFILSAMADQRKPRQNVGLENMNMMSQTTHTKYK